MLIDTHAHVMPSHFGPAPRDGAWPSFESCETTGARLLVTGSLRFPAKAVWYDAQERLEASAASGVDAELLSVFPALLGSAAESPDLCRVINSYIAGLCSMYPDRFYGLGVVPVRSPDAAAAFLSDVAEDGMAGVEIASTVPLHAPEFDGFLAEASRLGTAIFVHAMPTPSDRLPGPAMATFGVGTDGALAAAAIISSGAAEKHPGLRLAFSHAAGGFGLMLHRAQWFWGRTWNEEPVSALPPEAEPWAAPHGPLELARRFYYDSLVFDRRAIRYLIEVFGASQLLVGSDFPAMPREDPCGRTLLSMGLSDTELDDILWRNCFRFLGIIPTPRLFSIFVRTLAAPAALAMPGPVAQRPPRLLLTLLGDYWWRRTEPLPSAAIVGLLAEFGVSDAAARAALSRLTRNDLLVTSRSGRRTFVRLSARAAGILDDGARRIFSFGASAQPWDGMWSLVAFSIPEHDRALRDELRKALRWLGFAPLYDGLWVAPRDHVAEVIERLRELGIESATAFRATAVPAAPAAVGAGAAVGGAVGGGAGAAGGGAGAVGAAGVPGAAGGARGAGAVGIPERAWDLDGLRALYEEFMAFAGRLRDRTAAGEVSPTQALLARTRVMDEWRAFPAMDPDLPDELLPSAWPRQRARTVFIECYDLLGPLAASRVRQIVTGYAPDLADLVAYHSSRLTLEEAG